MQNAQRLTLNISIKMVVYTDDVSIAAKYNKEIFQVGKSSSRGRPLQCLE